MESSSLGVENSFPNQSSTEANDSEPQVPLLRLLTNKFTSFRKQIKVRLRKTIDYIRMPHG